MFRRLLLAISLAMPALAGLQDLAHCDPLKKDTSCPPDPAFAGRASFDFTKAGWDDELNDSWAVDSGTAEDNKHIGFTDDKGAAFSVWEQGQAPTLLSNKYFLFGKVSVEVLAARGPGLVTAIVLKSDSGDEIDWELLGAYDKQAQTNYFYDGQALFNTYNNTYTLDASPHAAFHKYSVEWTSTFLRFSIDGTERKTWHIGEIPAAKWPQTPMQVKLGIWSVSNDSDPGEIAWAGGLPLWNAPDDANDANDDIRPPFMAYFKTLDIEDYLGGCNETDAADVEYQYDERTYGWQDVQIKGCKKRVAPGIYTPDLSSSTQTDGPTPYAPEPPTTTASDTVQPSQTGDEEAPGDEGAAPLARELSSPLAAVLLLGWLLML